MVRWNSPSRAVEKTMYAIRLARVGRRLALAVFSTRRSPRRPGPKTCCNQLAAAFCMTALAGPLFCAMARGEEQLPLAELDLTFMTAGWGEPKVDLNCTGNPLRLSGMTHASGVGTHANSSLHVKLDGQAVAFRAVVGVDDQTDGRGSVHFRIYGDGKTLMDSGVMKGGEAGKPIDIPLVGVTALVLSVTSADKDNQFDHANWASAVFTYAGDTHRESAGGNNDGIKTRIGVGRDDGFAQRAIRITVAVTGVCLFRDIECRRAGGLTKGEAQDRNNRRASQFAIHY